MISTEELVKKFDNIYPVKFGKIKTLKADGSIGEIPIFDIDYEESERIRSTMTQEEKDNQRTAI